MSGLSGGGGVCKLLYQYSMLLCCKFLLNFVSISPHISVAYQICFQQVLTKTNYLLSYFLRTTQCRSPLFEYTFMYRILEWVILYLIQYQPYKYHCLGLWRAYRKNGSTLHLATHHWDVGPFEPRLQYSEEPDISDNFHLGNLLLELRNTWVYYIFDLELFLMFLSVLKKLFDRIIFEIFSLFGFTSIVFEISFDHDMGGFALGGPTRGVYLLIVNLLDICYNYFMSSDFSIVTG